MRSLGSSKKQILAVTASLVAGLVASFAACGQPPRSDVSAWLEEMSDAQRRVNNYIIRLDSLRDAIEAGDASALTVCDPASMQESYEPIGQKLTRLVREAGQMGFDQETQAALTRVEKNWALIQQLQVSRWKHVSANKDMDQKQLCLQSSDLIIVRLEIAEDQAKLLKAAARELAKK